MAIERLMGHLVLSFITREEGESFLKNRSGFGQRFQRRGLKAAGWAPDPFHLPNPCFVFSHSLSPAHFLVFWPHKMISAFPFSCPVTLPSSCSHSSGTGALSVVERHRFWNAAWAFSSPPHLSSIYTVYMDCVCSLPLWMAPIYFIVQMSLPAEGDSG